MNWLRGRAALQSAASLLAGVTFGAGLQVGGMTDPQKVLAFLDLAGAWDPSLILVLGAAVAVALVGFRFILRRGAPLWADRFDLSSRLVIDLPLVLGAAIFGVGWGLAGYCPGPALAGLALGNEETWIFVPALLLGSALHHFTRRPPATH